MRAKFNIERAKLDVNKGDTVSRIENEQAKLTLGDTEQKLPRARGEDQVGRDLGRSGSVEQAAEAREGAVRSAAGRAGHRRTCSCVRRPAGMVNVLTNYRASGPWGGQQVEFREGDRAWPGASIMELPDLSSVHLEAQARGGGPRPPARRAGGRRFVSKPIPGREFKATIERISVLAKVDYSSGWPPARNFELGLVLAEIDPKIRPGMSAVARIATDRRSRRDCSCPPRRSSSATATRSSTSSTAASSPSAGRGLAPRARRGDRRVGTSRRATGSRRGSRRRR